ncbi:MbtH family protein [Streptomyces sp. NC-S4]
MGRFTVVVNGEEQYSIWAEGREVPLGWRDTGVTGTKEECLEYIDEVWKDQRPLSVR